MAHLMNRKRTVLVFALTAVMAFCMGMVGCSNDEPAPIDETPEVVAVAGSVKAFHDGIGMDLGDITEASVENCATACHGGWEKIVASTAEYWPAMASNIGVGNPHASHGSNAYLCSDCHVFSEGPEILQCNGCHNYSYPDGWTEKSKATNMFGLVAEEPLY